MKTQLKAVFEQEVDRRQFLKYIGTIFLSLIGVANLLRLLGHSDVSKTPRGYGGSAYGGKKQGGRF